MESLIVNDHIRMESIKFHMAAQIFTAIDDNREYLEKWLPFVESTKVISDTEDFILGIIQQEEIKKDEIYSIWVDMEFAGLIGFKDTDWVNHKTEIGYWLIEKLQGKGIMTGCVEKMISYAFKKLRLNRIQIKVAVGNIKSAAIPKRLGLKFEGVERQGERHNNKFFDLEVYSLTRSDVNL